MFRQYQAIKARYPGVLLLFRLGDFYEMFGEDAQIGAQVLQLYLTSREIGKGNRVPMCGVPHHAIDRYVAKLLQAGYKVALCDQLEQPNPKKKLVDRDVTRVLTPGTLVEDTYLDARRPNYLAAVLPDDQMRQFGIGIAEVSTGEFRAGEVWSDQLWSLLSSLQPSEVLVPSLLANDEEWLSGIRSLGDPVITPAEGDPFQEPEDILKRHFGVTTLDGFGLENRPLAIRAASLLVTYIRQTHISALDHLTGLSLLNTEDYLILDSVAQRNLELTASLRDGSQEGTLLWVLDKTVTAMGARLLRRWLLQPLVRLSSIEERLDAVEELFKATSLRQEIREAFKGMPDLERMVSRAATGLATPRDLAQVRQSLRLVPTLKGLLEGCRSDLLVRLRSSLNFSRSLLELLERALVDSPPARLTDGGIFRDGYHRELDEVRQLAREGKNLMTQLEAEERDRTGIKNLKIGFNQVFGYYIEVSKVHTDKVPADYIRKQTLTDCERYITPTLKDLESKVLGAEERMSQLEYELFCQIRQTVSRHSEELLQTARAIAELDVLSSFAELAVRNNYVRPKMTENPEIWIRAGRHPVIEQVQKDRPFVPNDATLDTEEHQLIIITGPNAAGKSTYLRQVALIVLMAHMGSFVPAEEAVIGICDRIFTRIGAHDELVRGQSTFMVEMSETANILNNATKRSLVLVDEVGRGTSTYDGIAIAWSVAEELYRLGCRCLFATHYHQLTRLETYLPKVKNYRAVVKEEGDKVIFLYRILPGGTDKSYGIQVARLAGLPSRVIERAHEILEALEDEGSGKEPVEGRQESELEGLQLRLFEFLPHPLVERVKQIDPDSLSPREAHRLLYQLKQMVEI